MQATEVVGLSRWSMAEPLLEAKDLVEHYGSVEALRGASFTAYAGEVVSLVGDNGAGKSTLVKCLSGVQRPDSGSLTFGGARVVLDSPIAARALGVETVFQDLAVAPDLDPAANLFLGRELRKPGLLATIGKTGVETDLVAITKDDASSNEEFFHKQAC